jgi:hypothetical protein
MDYEIITPVELKYLKRITILQSWVFGPLTCEVVFCDQTEESSITAVFEGLSQIEIAKTSDGRNIGPLKVLDVRDKQWENINYKVKDYEEEFLSFYCRAFSIKKQEVATVDED